MTYLAIGVVFLLIGWLFYWLNNNSPIQTAIPAVALPLGAVLLVVGLAKVLP